MRKVTSKMNELQAKAICKWLDFKNSERGDTNFISIIIILAIVVVVGGLFFGIVTTFMPQLGQKINQFFQNILGASL